MKKQVHFKTVGSILRRAGYKPAGDFTEGFRIYKATDNSGNVMIDHDPEDSEPFDGDWNDLTRHCAAQLKLYKATLEAQGITVGYIRTGIPTMPLCLCAMTIEVIDPLGPKRGYIKAMKL